MTTSSLSGRVDFNTGSGGQNQIAIADLDGDGKLDVIVAESTGLVIELFRNTSTVGVLSTSSLTGGAYLTPDDAPQSVVVGDIDGDGKPDIVCGDNGTNKISVFRNRNIPGYVGSFDNRVDFPTTNNFTSQVAVGDIDGDGKQDIVVTYQAGNIISVFQNAAISGTITTTSLAPKVDIPTSSNPYIATLGDIDGDGKPDIAFSTINGISVFWNKATSGSINLSSFAAETSVFTSTGAPAGVTIGDLDGDGKPEIAFGLNATAIDILHNNPLTAITGNTTVCVGGTSTLSDATTGGTWSSSNTLVAVIGSSSGMVSALNTGTTTITYTVAGSTATTVVTVNTLTAISPANQTICGGSSITLSDATTGGTWSSSNTSVATIDASSGLVTGIFVSATGTSTISYITAGGCYATTTVTVNVGPAPLTGIFAVCAGGNTTINDAVSGGVWR